MRFPGLLTRSVIAKARRRRLSYVRRWKRGLRNAGYNCTRRRPRSSTARTPIAPGKYPERSFDFLGYTFRPKGAVNRQGERFMAFVPAVSTKAAKKMRCRVRRWRLHRRNDLELTEIATMVRPVLTGWVRYYGRFYPSKLQEELRTVDAFIVMGNSQIQAVPRTHHGDMGLAAFGETPQSRILLSLDPVSNGPMGAG